MPLDLAFDSLGDDEFQCLLFVMRKPVGWWSFLVVYPSKHISPRHVHWSSRAGVLAVGAPAPVRSPPFLPWLSRLPLPGAPVGSRPPPLSPAGSGGGCAASRTSGPAPSAGAPCGRLPPSPLGPATLRGMAAAAASPPAAVAAAATAAAEAIVPWC